MSSFHISKNKAVICNKVVDHEFASHTTKPDTGRDDTNPGAITVWFFIGPNESMEINESASNLWSRLFPEFGVLDFLANLC